jgi:hypothetical protein
MPGAGQCSSSNVNSHLLLLAVEVGLLAVLGGGVELRPQVLELLHAQIDERNQILGKKNKNHPFFCVCAPCVSVLGSGEIWAGSGNAGGRCTAPARP